MEPKTDASRLNSNRKRLGVAIVVISIVWLVLLPALARTDAGSNHLRWLETNQIDPSAMFYTELDCVDGLLDPSDRPK